MRQRNEAQVARKTARTKEAEAVKSAANASDKEPTSTTDPCAVYERRGSAPRRGEPAECIPLVRRILRPRPGGATPADAASRDAPPRTRRYVEVFLQEPAHLLPAGVDQSRRVQPGRTARVVLSCMDRTARIFDVATERLVTPPLEHGDSVREASFSPDGRKVVTISDDRTVRLWDAETGKPIHPPLKHEGVVHCATISPDGRRLVTTGDEPIARIWDVDTGHLRHFVIAAPSGDLVRGLQPGRPSSRHGEPRQDRPGVGHGDGPADHRATPAR